MNIVEVFLKLKECEEMLKIIVLLSFFTLASCFWNAKTKLNSKGQIVASSSEITIEALEKSQTFEPAEIIAKPGQKIKLKVVNGLKEAPVNFLVLQLGDDPVVVSQLALQDSSEKSAWVPASDYFIGGVKKLLAPSESERLTVELPKDEGIYYFVSTYPGQSENMQGKIIIQESEEADQTEIKPKQITDNSNANAS